MVTIYYTNNRLDKFRTARSILWASVKQRRIVKPIVQSSLKQLDSF